VQAAADSPLLVELREHAATTWPCETELTLVAIEMSTLVIRKSRLSRLQPAEQIDASAFEPPILGARERDERVGAAASIASLPVYGTVPRPRPRLSTAG